MTKSYYLYASIPSQSTYCHHGGVESIKNFFGRLADKLIRYSHCRNVVQQKFDKVTNRMRLMGLHISLLLLWGLLASLLYRKSLAQLDSADGMWLVDEDVFVGTEPQAGQGVEQIPLLGKDIGKKLSEVTPKEVENDANECGGRRGGERESGRTESGHAACTCCCTNHGGGGGERATEVVSTMKARLPSSNRQQSRIS